MAKQKEKQIDEGKEKVCGICNKKIVIPGEEYCILSQYTRDNVFFKDGSYHVKCFSERYLMKSQAQSLIDRTNKLLEKVEGRF